MHELAANPSRPTKPTADEVRVEGSDTHHPQGFGQKLSVPGICNAEGLGPHGWPFPDQCVVQPPQSARGSI